MSLKHEKLDYHDSKITYNVVGQLLKFQGPTISGNVTYDPITDTFILSGTMSTSDTIEYFASNPIPKNYSYSGSGLPFPNPQVAYENTPNHGLIHTNDNGEFQIKLYHPSEYYVKQGTKLLKPHVHLKSQQQHQMYTIILGDFLPYRSLSSLPNMPNRTIGR